MHKLWFLPLIFLTACALQSTPAPQVTPTETPLPFATATLAPTNTPRPSSTAAPATIAPTISPIMADLTNQVNVRTVPDAKSKVLGLLSYGTKVQIIGKDGGGQWWQIIYPQNSSSTGWISSAYVTVSDTDAATIPVAESGAANPVVKNTPANQTALPPTADLSPTPAARMAAVSNSIFVRSGPATSYSSLGTISAGTSVALLGRTQNNVWILIQYTAGPDGKGWVAGAYMKGADLSGLPYYDSVGNLVTAATPQTSVDPGQTTPTPSGLGAAAVDADSLKKPAVNLKFSPDGAKDLSYSSDLSSPNGDTADWVAFTPYEPTNQSTYVYFKLVCTGNGGITAT